MGSPLGLTLAHAFSCILWKQLQNCPSDFKPHYYQRYNDDIFVLFILPKHLKVFRNFLIGQHLNMSYTIENEKQNRMSFLNVQIIREDKAFTTSVYHTPIFSRVSTHFGSFSPSNYKLLFTHSLIDSFEYAQVRLITHWFSLYLKEIFLKDSCP